MYVVIYSSMLEQSTTYMKEKNHKSGMVTKRRRTVHVRDDIFSLLNQFVSRHGDTKENIVSKAIEDLVSGTREKFLKAYAPHITLEHTSQNAIFINDTKLKKMAVVKPEWIDVKKNPDDGALLRLWCETCESENCIHVRYSLVLPDVLRIEKGGKLV